MSSLPTALVTGLLLVGGLSTQPLTACDCGAETDPVPPAATTEAANGSAADANVPAAGATAATEAEAPPSLEDTMSTLKSALRKIKRGAYGDNLDETHLTQVDRAIAAVTSASQIMPETANTDALQQAYSQQIQAVLATLQTLKTAVKQADAAQTKQLLEQLDQQEDQGHEQFRKEDDDEDE